MDNIFEEAGHGIEAVAKDIAHVVVEAVEFPAKATKVITTLMKDYPELRAELQTLVIDGQKALVDGVAAVGAKGLNWAEDVAVVGDVTAFARYFKDVFVPAVEKAYGELNTDVVDTPPAATPGS